MLKITVHSTFIAPICMQMDKGNKFNGHYNNDKSLTFASVKHSTIPTYKVFRNTCDGKKKHFNRQLTTQKLSF